MSARITEAELRTTDGHTPGNWQWGQDWRIEKWGEEPDGVKYADLQLYAGGRDPYQADAVTIIPIRIDHYRPIFDAAGPDAITPADRALIALAPRLLAEVRRLQELMISKESKP